MSKHSLLAASGSIISFLQPATQRTTVALDAFVRGIPVLAEASTSYPCLSLVRAFASRQGQQQSRGPAGNFSHRLCCPSLLGDQLHSSACIVCYGLDEQLECQQWRSVFGLTRQKAVNPQIHTHEKYKNITAQPTYDWMQGRFVVDRNNVIWHKGAGFGANRSSKSTSHLSRVKRIKPLHQAYAAKLLKLGFRNRFWAEPDPRDVPGFERAGAAGQAQRKRRDARPDLDPTYGDPALRQSYTPPPRQKPW